MLFRLCYGRKWCGPLDNGSEVSRRYFTGTTQGSFGPGRRNRWKIQLGESLGPILWAIASRPLGALYALCAPNQSIP